MKEQAARAIGVMAVGNVLTGDDGLGPYVLEVLEASYQFPPTVSLLELGTPGIDLTMFLEPLDALVVVDTVKADAPPGSVKAYRRAELLEAPLPVVMSPHEPTLREALLRLQLLGRGPEDVLLIGAVPAQFALGESLSAPLRAAVPALVAAVLAELERLGAPALARPKPRAPVFWWERRPSAEGVACASASLGS